MAEADRYLANMHLSLEASSLITCFWVLTGHFAILVAGYRHVTKFWQMILWNFQKIS